MSPKTLNAFNLDKSNFKIFSLEKWQNSMILGSILMLENRRRQGPCFWEQVWPPCCGPSRRLSWRAAHHPLFPRGSSADTHTQTSVYNESNHSLQVRKYAQVCGLCVTWRGREIVGRTEIGEMGHNLLGNLSKTLVIDRKKIFVSCRQHRQHGITDTRKK